MRAGTLILSVCLAVCGAARARVLDEVGQGGRWAGEAAGQRPCAPARNNEAVPGWEPQPKVAEVSTSTGPTRSRMSRLPG